MGLFTEHDNLVERHKIGESLRRRLSYLKRSQKSQREGSKAFKQFDVAINELKLTFEHLREDGIIDKHEETPQ